MGGHPPAPNGTATPVTRSLPHGLLRNSIVADGLLVELEQLGDLRHGQELVVSHATADSQNFARETSSCP